MKKYFMIALAGLATSLFAETTLCWVFDGYAENEAKVVEASTSLSSVDTTVFVEFETQELDVSTEAPGMTVIVR